jgi:hypothetical protein
MKILITENKLHNAIYQYIDGDFNKDDIHWTYGMSEDEDGYSDMDNDNENYLIFYKGDWGGEEDSDIVFHYFDVDYYRKDDPSHKPFREQSPILIVNDWETLTSTFGNHWIEPMKEWFEDKFGLPVKTITAD